MLVLPLCRPWITLPFSCTWSEIKLFLVNETNSLKPLLHSTLESVHLDFNFINFRQFQSTFIKTYINYITKSLNCSPQILLGYFYSKLSFNLNQLLSLSEIAAFGLYSKSFKGIFLKNKFPPMKVLEFITGHLGSVYCI